MGDLWQAEGDQGRGDERDVEHCQHGQQLAEGHLGGMEGYNQVNNLICLFKASPRVKYYQSPSFFSLCLLFILSKLNKRKLLLEGIQRDMNF